MLKVAVVGVGTLGQHHARNYARMENVDLVAVVDTNEANVNNIHKITKNNQVESLRDYKDLVGKIDAVSIVTPTPLHYEMAKFFLEHKIHCLVEKPITTTLEQADELIYLAEINKLVLQVGHIGRFNPAIVEIQDFVKQPKYIDINRLGPYSPRVSHVGVVLDLMVHDLDMVLFLTDSEVESVDAIGTRVISEHEDIANVRLKFKNGCVANISASRVSLDKFRKIRIFQKDSYISLDYEKQSFKVYTKKKNVEKVESLSDISIKKISAKKNEPLYLELLDFVDCVIKNKKPKVDGIHGRNALKLALDVITKISESMD